MLKQETGTVVQLADGQAAIRIRSEPGDACGGCKACRTRGGGDFLLWVEAENLKASDRVTVEVAVPGPWRAVFLVFVLPLAFFVTGILVGGEWQGFQEMTGLGRDASGIALGVGLLPVPVLIAILAERRFRRRHRPRVTKVGGGGKGQPQPRGSSVLTSGHHQLDNPG